MEEMFELAGRATFIKVDLDVLLQNYENIKSSIGNKTEIIAVVKANAYGHGSVAICQHLQNHGCTSFAVATTHEGQELREAGIKGTILVLGNATQFDIPTMCQQRLTPSVADVHVLRLWRDYSDKINTGRCEVVIEVDVGMNRNGCTPEALSDIVTFCDRHNIPIHSIMTHFSNAWDAVDSNRQLQRFLDVVNPFRERGIHIHAASSGSIANGLATDLDFVRPGLILYGLSSATSIPLIRDGGYRPALSWFARPSLVKNVRAGSSIGYRSTYICTSAERIATLPVGFADGYPKRLSGKPCITDEKGSVHEIAGLMSMDTMTVKVQKYCDKRTVFCLLSDNIGHVNSCHGLASLANTFLCDILANIDRRVPKLYILHGKIKKEEEKFYKEKGDFVS